MAESVQTVTDPTAPEEPKKKRARSPNYPAIELEAAIGLAKTLHDRDGCHPLPVELAHTRLGYKANSSVATQAEAALKAFGLLAPSGEGSTRKVAVSSTADRIIRNAPDRDALIKEAAVAPKVFRELWNLYSKAGFPSDEVIASYLVWDRPDNRFTEDGAAEVIKRFKSTIAFAKLVAGDIIKEVSEDPDGGGDGDPLPPPPSKKGFRMVHGVLPLPLLMQDGSIAVIDIPRMTAGAFDFFKKQLDMYRAAIVIEEAAPKSSKAATE